MLNRLRVGREILLEYKRAKNKEQRIKTKAQVINRMNRNRMIEQVFVSLESVK